MVIVETSGHLESIKVVGHHLLCHWPVYRVGANGGESRICSVGIQNFKWYKNTT
jgi:hypothetical protein